MRVHWVEAGASGRVGIRPHPAGGTALREEMRALRASGADILVSLLEPDEALRLELDEEASLAAACGLRFVSHPIRDHSLPSDAVAFGALVDELATCVRDGRSVAIHCLAGIGRSSMLGAGVLTALGLDVHAAFEALTRARGLPVPDTVEQRTWVERFVAGRPSFSQQPSPPRGAGRAGSRRASP